MKMDRNENLDGKGKYALVRLRGRQSPVVKASLTNLDVNHRLDWGRPNEKDEFFVIKLRDRYARDALLAYAEAAQEDDPEWATEVAVLASRSGFLSAHCKRPD